MKIVLILSCRKCQHHHWNHGCLWLHRSF